MTHLLNNTATTNHENQTQFKQLSDEIWIISRGAVLEVYQHRPERDFPRSVMEGGLTYQKTKIVRLPDHGGYRIGLYERSTDAKRKAKDAGAAQGAAESA